MGNGNYFENPNLQLLLDNSKLVIFDMNGMIVDDEKIQLEAVNLALSEFHVSTNEEHWIEKCVGRRAENFLQDLLEEEGIDPHSYSIPRIVQQKTAITED